LLSSIIKNLSESSFMFKDISPVNSKRALWPVSLLKMFCGVFLAAGLAVSAHAGGSLTGSSGNGWHSLVISPAATGTFTATYDATPSISPENSVIGLSNGAATAFGNLGCIARFNSSGNIDAYNGSGYQAASTIHYSAGVSYHFEMDVNVTTHTYSVYVTPAGGSTTLVGSNYAFRSSANTMTSLTDWNLDVDPSIGGASLTAINLSVSETFTISASAGSGGSISPSGGVPVNQGANQSFTISPNAGFSVSSVTVDGVNQGPILSYTFTNVQANHTISAAFSAGFTINASAGSNGTITPSGTITVSPGSNQSFAISPNPGFSVLTVTVDGANVGPVTSYTFTNVQANHTINATFSPVPTTFAVTSLAGANGTITPSGTTTVSPGSSQAFTITPASGFMVSNLIADGVSQGPLNSYTFSNIQSNDNITVSFQPVAPTFTIAASAGSGGTITASNATGVTPLTGTITVIQGAAQWFTIVPQPGFAVSSLTVDGVSVAVVSPYKFTNVQTNHTISVAFQAVPTFTITPTAGANGTINMPGQMTVNQGASQAFTISPNFGYTVSSVTVDGANVGAVSIYTFSNVQANHTISATFTASGSNSYLTSAYITQAIRTVTDYAVEHPSTDSSNNKALPYTWVRAALADALAQAYFQLGDTHYLNAVNCWAEGTRSETYWLNGLRTPTYVPVPEDTAPGAIGTDIWQPASRSALPTTDAHWFIPGTNTYMDIQYHADDSSPGHAYLQLFDLDPTLPTDKNYRYKIGKMAGIQTRMDYVISNPNSLTGRKIWWWADAYFMATPNLAHLAKITGDPKYAAALDSMFWDSSAYLLSTQDNLFFRDDKYFPGQLLGSTAHGNRVIWSRAQGWTMAALVEVLTYLPSTDPQYANYVALFQNMAAAVKARQQPSGLWHSSLNDSNDGYPGAGFSVGQVDGDETSGSAFLIYGIAWGIGNGLLSSTDYGTVVKNGWIALQSKIQPNGSLGYSEIVGQDPAEVQPGDTTDFGNGAFALAGLEVKALYGTP
jgi:rhamnogalacturonyl hydrolase YesR